MLNMALQAWLVSSCGNFTTSPEVIHRVTLRSGPVPRTKFSLQ